MTFNRDEYARACERVNKTPLYRATCPPEDELASLRDCAIEEIADDIIDEAIEIPAIMSEMFLENDYDQEGLLEMAAAASAMMSDTKSLDAKIAFAAAAQEFLELKAVSLAEEKIDD